MGVAFIIAAGIISIDEAISVVIPAIGAGRHFTSQLGMALGNSSQIGR